jgi:hypothetical protein
VGVVAELAALEEVTLIAAVCPRVGEAVERAADVEGAVLVADDRVMSSLRDDLKESRVAFSNEKFTAGG